MSIMNYGGGRRLRGLVVGGVLGAMAGCGPGSAGGTDTTATVGMTETESATMTDGTETTPTGDASTTVEATEPGSSTTTEGATEPGTSTTTTEGATEPGTSTATESETETDGAPVCPCIEPEEEGGWGDEPSLPICGEPVCPTVEIGKIGNAPISPCDDAVKEGDAVPLMNPEALTCALTALRDRTPGLIGWNCGDHQGDMFSDSGYVLIGADGVAIRRHWGAYDLSWTVWRAEQGALPDPDVFEQCLASGDDATRWECLRNFLMGEPILVCDELWGVSFD